MAVAEAPNTVKRNIALRLPENIAELLGNKATEAGLRNSNRYVLNLICADLGVEMPKSVRTRAPKYATDEERTAARKASVEKRNARIKEALELLAKYEAGEFSNGHVAEPVEA